MGEDFVAMTEIFLKDCHSAIVTDALAPVTWIVQKL